mgnify:CR=1 FL=1
MLMGDDGAELIVRDKMKWMGILRLTKKEIMFFCQ